jgi:hypothetical protein
MYIWLPSCHLDHLNLFKTYFILFLKNKTLIAIGGSPCPLSLAKKNFNHLDEAVEIHMDSLSFYYIIVLFWRLNSNCHIQLGLSPYSHSQNFVLVAFWLPLE